MSELDQFYIQLLHVGFTVLRQAVDAKETHWVEAELEFLHNIPSLIGEENVERHRYFWLQERTHFVQRINSKGTAHARSRLNTFYAPILEEMSSVMEEYLNVQGVE